MFVPPVAKSKSKASASQRSTGGAGRGPGVAEHSDSQQEKAGLGAQDAGQPWDFSKIRLSSPGSGNSIQAKVKVGGVNDPLEHEADRAADQALRIPELSAVSGSPQPRARNIQPALRANAAAKTAEQELADPSSGPSPDSFRGRGSPIPARSEERR